MAFNKITAAPNNAPVIRNFNASIISVSYTHLTLPTILLV